MSGEPPVLVTLSMLTLAPGNHGGGEVYAKELCARLPLLESAQAEVLLPRGARGWNGGLAERVLRVQARSGTVPRLLSMLGVWFAGRSVRRTIGEAAVVHYPLTIPLPGAGARRSVVTLADMQHRDLPALFSPAERLFRRFAYDRAAQRADAVVTVSEFTKERIHHHLGVPLDRIHVAYLGVDAERFSPNFGAREPFIYYPARAWAHKNHARLFEALRLLRERRPELRLVLTGGDTAKLHPLPEGVDVLGHVTEARLAELYRTASAVVFPSLYEGFGLPVLEAMASGCPVAASDRASLPEICGDAAELFDPTDPVSIAEGVERAIRRSEELAARGVSRASSFSWDACVAAHLPAYRGHAAAR